MVEVDNKRKLCFQIYNYVPAIVKTFPDQTQNQYIKVKYNKKKMKLVYLQYKVIRTRYNKILKDFGDKGIKMNSESLKTK